MIATLPSSLPTAPPRPKAAGADCRQYRDSGGAARANYSNPPLEIFGSALESLVQIDAGFPTEQRPGAGNIRFARLRIAFNAFLLLIDNACAVIRQLVDHLCKLKDSKFVGIADVDRFRRISES